MERCVLYNSVIFNNTKEIKIDKAYLPKSILWRQKEQFSDGVGYSWIDGYVLSIHIPSDNCWDINRMKNHASEVVSDESFAKRQQKWSFDVPDTKEAYLIRDIFDGKVFCVHRRIGT